MAVTDELWVLGLTESAPTEEMRAWLPRSADQIRSQVYCFSLQAMEEQLAAQRLRWKEGHRETFPVLLHNHRSGLPLRPPTDPPPGWRPSGKLRCNAGCKILFPVPAQVAEVARLVVAE